MTSQSDRKREQGRESARDSPWELGVLDGILHTDDPCVENERMREEQGFELCWCDLESLV